MALSEMAQVQQVLSIAQAILSGDRRESYGSPRESFARIATLWSAYLGYAISSHDVAMLMILLKMARQKNKHKEDNLVDICGYASLATVLEECNEERSDVPGHDDSSEFVPAESVRYVVDSNPCPTNCRSLQYDAKGAFCKATPNGRCPGPFFTATGVCFKS